MTSTMDQDGILSTVIAEQWPRLRSFIRRRVPNQADVEDLLQEVMAELVEAHRLLKPIDVVSAWLYRVARNRITDLFRKRKPEDFTDLEVAGEDGEAPGIEELLPSPDAGPEALYLRRQLIQKLDRALLELPREQREVFIAHELEGKSFKQLVDETGVGINTLLARKRYAVLALRRRLRKVYEELE
ncbi:MAG TPA: sigma-70 family RNA polymerase sigma factor [Terracidiphilus sp.]|nr:sigma-70 family RNA polymerase sigma factor [Terracidiphilus sp.]